MELVEGAGLTPVPLDPPPAELVLGVGLLGVGVVEGTEVPLDPDGADS